MARPPDGPVHEWFGLSYCNYQVLHRTLMQSMPTAWQERMVACLEELAEAFDHLERSSTFIVTPAVERQYDELTPADRRRLKISCRRSGRDWLYYDDEGNEHHGWESVLVAAGRDSVPHYNRGRAYVEPHLPPEVQP
jgi:hypothetical protein